MRIDPFRIEIPESTLTDLRDRLKRTRWAHEFANDGWAYGTNRKYLKEVHDYWLNQYDWRAQEKAMNALPNFKTEIDGVPIHFVHQKGRGPKPMPLILSHGWPWTYWDLHKVIGPLSDPAAHGGDPKDAFDVVVPSLPGYGFSTPLTKTGQNFWTTADLWVKLMREGLGYEKFSAEGGDWGAAITGALGHKHSEHLHGIYLHLTCPLEIFQPGASLPGPSDYAADEPWHDMNINFFTQESGYSALQMTKPQTIAFALEDSPVGLLAWLVEKRRTWSDCGGDVERRFTKDDLCTTATIYWATQSYGTSARYYYECTHNPWKPSHQGLPVVKAPTGMGVFKDVIILPKSWAEKYYNLKRWTRMDSGGHFAPMEEPELLVEDVRAFFRELR